MVLHKNTTANIYNAGMSYGGTGSKTNPRPCICLVSKWVGCIAVLQAGIPWEALPVLYWGGMFNTWVPTPNKEHAVLSGTSIQPGNNAVLPNT